MSQIGGERTLYSTLPDGGEFVLVSSAPAMGYERHYLFYGEEGPKPTVYDYGTIYTPIYGDLDEQYARDVYKRQAYPPPHVLLYSNNVKMKKFGHHT